MLTIVLLLAAASLLAPTAARRVFPLRYAEEIRANADAYEVDRFLLAAIVYEESKFSRSSRSQAGAVGLMQIMPETGVWAATRMGRPELGRKLTDPRANLAVGSWYFHFLLERYGNESLALAAYNGGQRNVDKWLAANPNLAGDELIEIIPFSETRRFVRRVERTRLIYQWLY